MVVSFIGHRDIEDKGRVYEKIVAVMRELIINNAADVFLFGNRGAAPAPREGHNAPRPLAFI